MRLGLCCTFIDEDIRFRTTTARYLGTQSPARRRALLRELGLHNAHALSAAIAWCVAHDVGAFRVTSGMLPMRTHPERGYRLEQLDKDGAIHRALTAARDAARAGDVRLSMHPDQFVVPGSASEAVRASSLGELEHQAEIATLVGAEQITIHGGGAQGGKQAALARLVAAIDDLSPRARELLVLENDDRVYTVEDLLPACAGAGLRLVYDVHHHRLNPDELSIEEATRIAGATWRGDEPWVHLSSPAGGWRAKNPCAHADYIALLDFPEVWRGARLTIDVEAKAKERAVLRLARALQRSEVQPTRKPAARRHRRTGS